MGKTIKWMLDKLVLFLEQPAKAIIIRLVLYAIVVYTLAILYAVLFVKIGSMDG